MSACVNISDTVDVLSHTIPCRVYREWADMRKHPVSDSCLGENTLLISEENGQITSSSWEGNSNSKKTPLITDQLCRRASLGTTPVS